VRRGLYTVVPPGASAASYPVVPQEVYERLWEEPS
jgi:hypothetical protein